jgi:hypothetical protein
MPFSRHEKSRLWRSVKLLAVTVGAVMILWGSYSFRFAESHTGREAFNRSLQDKIADVHSLVYRSVISTPAVAPFQGWVHPHKR